MKNNQSLPNAAMLSSHGTSAYETGIQFSNGNPYEFFHSRGIDLTSFAIRILKKPRTNGVAITCRANINGIIYTVGAANYDTLMAELLDDILRHRQKIILRQKQKKERKTEQSLLRFINKYPDATVLPSYFIPNMEKGGAA